MPSEKEFPVGRITIRGPTDDNCQTGFTATRIKPVALDLLHFEVNFQSFDRHSCRAGREQMPEQFVHAFEIQCVEIELPIASEFNQSGIPKLREMMAHSRLRLAEFLANCRNVHLAVFRQQKQNADSMLVCEAFEHACEFFHGAILSVRRRGRAGRPPWSTACGCGVFRH